jgi:hypothetical protein
VLADDARAVRAFHHGLDEVDDLVAGFDVHTGIGVGELL